LFSRGAAHSPTSSKKDAVVTQNASYPVIFADGLGRISVVNGVVRLDFVEVEPQQNGANQEKVVGRVMLPLPMLAGLLTDLGRINAGAAAPAPTMAPPAAPSPQAQPSGKTMIPAPPLPPPPRWNPST
jgi:hypothetical protein